MKLQKHKGARLIESLNDIHEQYSYKLLLLLLLSEHLYSALS